MLWWRRRIWELYVHSDPYLSVQGDLQSIADVFDRPQVADGWTPPPYEILGRSKPVADFTGWAMAGAFLVRERVREALAEVCGSDAQFLPFGEIKRQRLYAVKVLRTENVLDLRKTQFFYGDIPEVAVFKRWIGRRLPPLFKVHGSRLVYVSRDFGELAVSQGWTGVKLADPGKARLPQVLRQEEVNVFPGLDGPAIRKG